jgi:hypothetical protein
VNEFHYVIRLNDLRLDKINAIELVFWYEARNVFIFNRSLLILYTNFNGKYLQITINHTFFFIVCGDSEVGPG